MITRKVHITPAFDCRQGLCPACNRPGARKADHGVGCETWWLSLISETEEEAVTLTVSTQRYLPGTSTRRRDAPTGDCLILHTAYPHGDEETAVRLAIGSIGSDECHALPGGRCYQGPTSSLEGCDLWLEHGPKVLPSDATPESEIMEPVWAAMEIVLHEWGQHAQAERLDKVPELDVARAACEALREAVKRLQGVKE